MIRSPFRGILVAIAAAALVFGVFGMTAPAFANTELVPATRLIAPFFDISSGRSTFYLLTNVSGNVSVDGSSVLGQLGVHLEHYGQSCARNDESDFLTEFDIDQFDLAVNSIVRNLTGAGQTFGPVTPTAGQSGVAGRGWTDIDVRRGAGTLTSSPSIALNVLLGTVVISDFGADFALAYPMASVLGSSYNGLIGATIVTRTGNGTAAAWTGRYEPLPARVFVPAYFAEGTDASGPNAGQTFTAFLAIAGPPDGNWAAFNNGEAPGQGTGGGSIANLGLGFAIFDGCETNFSAQITTHYLNNTYDKLFGANTNRSTWFGPLTGGCPQSQTFGDRDELSGQAVGWIDVINNNVACDNNSATTACPVTGTTPGVGTGQPRGMVGITIEDVSGTGITTRLGDVTRLWGDPSPWGFPSSGTGFTAQCQAGFSCFYSLVNAIRWDQVKQNGNILIGVNATTQ